MGASCNRRAPSKGLSVLVVSEIDLVPIAWHSVASDATVEINSPPTTSVTFPQSSGYSTDATHRLYSLSVKGVWSLAIRGTAD